MRTNWLELYEGLLKDFGAEKVTTDTLERIAYSHDLAPVIGPVRTTVIRIFFRMIPDIIFRPNTASEVSEVVRRAHIVGIPITPRGASTASFGGAVPGRGGLLLDLTGMNEILDFDKNEMVVKVQAGVRWKDLQDYLNTRGYMLGAYPSSAPSATVGGWISTGGLGIGSLKYGSVGEQVTSLKVVTPTGEIINTTNNNQILFASGYNLNWLYIGAEGTLGTVTEAVIKVYPKHDRILPLAYSFKSLADAQTLLINLLHSNIKPFHVEFLDQGCLEMSKKLKLKLPEADALLLIIFEGENLEVERGSQTFHDLCANLIEEGKAAFLPSAGEGLWEGRFMPLRVKRLGPSFLGEEVIIPLNKIEFFIKKCHRYSRLYRAHVAVKGFVAAHNSMVMMPSFFLSEKRKFQFILSYPLSKDIVNLGIKCNGKPYGAGLWNYFFMRLGKGQPAVEFMKLVKMSIDKKNSFNPSKTVSVRTRLRFDKWIEDELGFPAAAIVFNIGLIVLGWITKAYRFIINVFYPKY
ncbi:MAG: FAD-binding oxidoreductase [Candidatus Bathyarchaeota archaeon]